MKKFVALIVLFSSTFIVVASNFNSKFDAYSKILLGKIASTKSSEVVLRAKTFGYPFETIDNQIFVNCLIELDSKNSTLPENCKIISRAENIVAVQIPLSKLNEIASSGAVHHISLGRKYRLLMDSARKSVKADLVHQGTNLPKPYTGKGVIIGIFDTGIDLLHPDFSDENGTRVLFLWDMSETASPKPPQGFDWGREYTKQEIDQNLDNVLQKDKEGHGTHVAGIAAGNGKGKPEYKGIAPEADLIVVNGTRGDNSNSFTDADILSACNYIFSKADELNKPCVINLSLGSILGSHDGEDLLSKALSNLVSEKKSRAIVVSAGNEGELLIHSGGQMVAGKRYELLLYPYNLCDYQPELCPDIPGYFLFGADLWTDPEIIDSVYIGIYDQTEMQFLAEKGFSAKDIIDNVQIFDNENQLVGLVSLSNEAAENSENILIFISNEGQQDLPIANYLWSIVMVAKNNGKFDSWSAVPIGAQTQVPGVRFERFYADNLMTINSPAVGKKMISVGATVSKNKFINILGETEDWSQFTQIGDLAGFSSRGPSRDGRILPIITAPGMVVFSALSSSTNPELLDSANIDPSGIYLGNIGTSMSAPVVTGAVALLFEQNPDLSIDEIIELLKLSALSDEFTGTVPNNNFGWGKLDLLRLLQLVTEVRENVELSGVAIYPNPVDNFFFVSVKKEIKEIEIFDVLGNILFKTNHFVVTTENLPKGIFLARIKTTDGVYRLKFIK